MSSHPNVIEKMAQRAQSTPSIHTHRPRVPRSMPAGLSDSMAHFDELHRKEASAATAPAAGDRVVTRSGPKKHLQIAFRVFV